MLSTILSAKLYRSPTTPTSVARPQLWQRLDDGLVCKFTLVSAPGGFGKSSLISAWLDHLDQLSSAIGPESSLGEPSPIHKASWLTLDQSDNQLPRFVRYLIAAIENSYPKSCTTAAGLLQEQPFPTVELLTDVLIECLIQLAGPLILVLDDLHLLDDAAIHAFLALLIQHGPPHFHLVLITRVDPPFPLSRWRARGMVNELRLRDLSFDVEETREFLQMSLENLPPDEIVASLHQQTEGWAVGLRLMALALRGETDYDAFLAGLRGNSNRYIADYLMDDVLDQQPPGVQQFLICTSVLTRFCPALCATVMEIDEATARQHIDHVTRKNLFLIGLSSPDYWYRYHHQFQDMLTSKLYDRYDQQAVATLHRLAAGWLASNGQIEEALRHLIAIPDLVAAAELVESQRLAALNRLRFEELERWLVSLPTALLHKRPVLLLSLAWVQFDQTDMAGCLTTTLRADILLQETADSFSEVTRILLQAEVAALRVASDRALDRSQALVLIRLHWLRLRPYLTFTHCHVLLWFAYIAQRLGELKLGLTIVLTTLDETAVWPKECRGRLLHTAGYLYWCDGNMVQAERTFQENLRLARQHELLLTATISHHGLGAIADARNQQEDAEYHHLEVAKNPQLNSGRSAVEDVYSLLKIYARRGQPEAASGLVEQLKRYALRVGTPYLLDQVAALEAYLALCCGNLATAMRWALFKSPGEMYNGADRAPVIRAQILLAEGSSASLQEAVKLLQELESRHIAEHTWHRLAEALTLLALAWDKLDEPERAMAALGKAVQIAVPNGMVGLFLEHGLVMQGLLERLAKHSEHAHLVQLLLAASAVTRTDDPPVPQQEFASTRQASALVEPLTDRELDILTLLADRLSNKEIAQQLIISAHTVRNHTANIFGKLGVENRHQAVAKAHSLGLLPLA